MTDKQADRIVAAIGKGFNDLGDRIAQGTNPENVAMSLKMIADSLDGLGDALRESVADLSNDEGRDRDRPRR